MGLLAIAIANFAENTLSKKLIFLYYICLKPLLDKDHSLVVGPPAMKEKEARPFLSGAGGYWQVIDEVASKIALIVGFQPFYGTMSVRSAVLKSFLSRCPVA